MKAVRTDPIRLVLAAGWFALPAAALALSPGDAADRVIAELGPPPNAITIGTRHIYDYDRGRVEIENGLVIRADLISEADVAERTRRRQEALAVAAEQAKRAERQRREDGRALLAERLRDPRFVTAPAAERIAFFRAFAALHPDIPIDAEYREALREAQRDMIARTAAAASPPAPDRSREIEQLKLDVLEARLRSLEAENAVLQLGKRPTVPQTVVNVHVEAPYPDVVVVPAVGPRRADPPPPPDTDDLWGRYSITRRLPPPGTPTFGGGAAAGR